MKKIRNKNTGAEYSSSTLKFINGVVESGSSDIFVDETDKEMNSFHCNGGWEEVKDDNLINVPFWILDGINDALQICYNDVVEEDMKGGESCLQRMLRSSLNCVQKLKDDVPLTGLEMYEKLKEVKEDNSSIEEAAKEYTDWATKGNNGDKFNFANGDIKETFITAAIWMRDSYLKEVGIDKVFEEWQKEKEDKK